MWLGAKLESDKGQVQWDHVAVPRPRGLSQGSRGLGRGLSWLLPGHWVCVGEAFLSAVWRVQWEVEEGEGEEHSRSDLQEKALL